MAVAVSRMSTAAMPDLLFRPVERARRRSCAPGELSARELVQASLDRIDALNPSSTRSSTSSPTTRSPRPTTIAPGDARPFAGVPIAIKNNRAIAGRRLTFGADFFGDCDAPYDHNVVARASRRRASSIVGTTTLPEWGILPSTEHASASAPTRNPWDPARTHAAAPRAARRRRSRPGMVPIAHANDGGGSTRIPAACCGLVGLKPQRGRISLAPRDRARASSPSTAC